MGTKLIKLTRPDDVAIWVNPKQIVAVTVPIEGEGPLEALTSIVLASGNRLLVKQTVRDVVEAL